MCCVLPIFRDCGKLRDQRPCPYIRDTMLLFFPPCFPAHLCYFAAATFRRTIPPTLSITPSFGVLLWSLQTLSISVVLVSVRFLWSILHSWAKSGVQVAASSSMEHIVFVGVQKGSALSIPLLVGVTDTKRQAIHFHSGWFMLTTMLETKVKITSRGRCKPGATPWRRLAHWTVRRRSSPSCLRTVP